MKGAVVTKRKTIKWWKDELGYTSKAELETAIRDIVKGTADGQPLLPDEQEFLHTVLKHHYQYAAKVGGGVKHIEIRTNPSWNGPTRGLWFVRTDDTAIDISWVMALQPEGKPTPKNHVTSAARYEVYPQIHEHHANGACVFCELCGEGMMRGVGLHVDHDTQFDTLLLAFLDDSGLTYDDVEIEDLGLDSRFADRELAIGWSSYHREVARLRLVHSDCNLHRSRS
jgi:hypothetical protein